MTAQANSLEELTGYRTGGGGEPTGIVFDGRIQNRFYVADNVKLWSTQTGGAPAPNVTFQNLTPNLMPLGVVARGFG